MTFYKKVVSYSRAWYEDSKAHSQFRRHCKAESVRGGDEMGKVTEKIKLTNLFDPTKSVEVEAVIYH